MVVLDALVVDDAPERELLQAGDVFGSLGVAVVAPYVGRGRLDLADHVRGEEARARARVRDRLVLLVEPLRRGERPPRGEAEEGVRIPLERRQVVEELRRLALGLLLQLRDRARLPGCLGDDRRRLVLLDPLPSEIAPAVQALTAGREARLDEPVGLRGEGADLELPPDDQREGRRLHPAQGDGAVEGRAQADRGRARRVHADEPVRLGARPRRLLEQVHLLAVAQVLEGLLDRGLRHRVQPQALDGLLHARGLVEVGEDQLPLAPGVAGVDDQLDVLVLHQLVDGVELLLGLLVVGDELELLRHDRQVLEAPLLQLLVVLVGLGETDQVAHRPRDHVVAVGEVRLVLALLEGTRQRGREVAAHGGLFGDDQCLRHGVSP